MSALPPKADMISVELDVCFVPQADIEVCRIPGLRHAVQKNVRHNDGLAYAFHGMVEGGEGAWNCTVCTGTYQSTTS